MNASAAAGNREIKPADLEELKVLRDGMYSLCQQANSQVFYEIAQRLNHILMKIESPE